jgi:hypothetical protein
MNATAIDVKTSQARRKRIKTFGTCLGTIFILLSMHYVDSNLLIGFVIIFIAWIMDEGRKIQEEQELTV